MEILGARKRTNVKEVGAFSMVIQEVLRDSCYSPYSMANNNTYEFKNLIKIPPRKIKH